MTVPTPEGFISQPGDMDIRASYCGTLDNDIKPENKCNSVKEQFYSLSDTLYAVSKIGFENIQTDCGKLDMCEKNCVYEEHRPKKKRLSWWEVLIIVILILIIVAVIILLLCCKFCRKCAVNPKDEEAGRSWNVHEEDGIFFEHLSVIRIGEIERYLDDAIASKDMADLKLTIEIVEQENFQNDLRQKYDTAVRLLNDLMARDTEVKRIELDEEERQADETKKALQDAEKDILIRLRAKEEAALRRAIKTRDETKDKWAKMWPKLKVLRSLNGINAQLVEKVMVEARIAKEEEGKQSRFEEDQANEAAYCKQLLKESIASDDDGKLVGAMKTTDWAVFQNPIMDTDEELKDLRKKARDELEMIRNDTVPLIIPLLRREKKAEQRRGEEEIADANKKEEVESAEAQRNEKDGRENEAEEKNLAEEIIAEINKKEEELTVEQRYETIEREREAEEERIAEAIKKEEEELAEAQQHEAIQREKEAKEKRQEEERVAEAIRKEKEELAEAQQHEAIKREKKAEKKRQEEERVAEAIRKEEEELADTLQQETIKREREAEEKRQEEEKIAEANRKEEEERIAEENREEEERLKEALRHETIQRQKEAEEKRQEEERIAEEKRKEEDELAEAQRLETIEREREAEEKKQEEERLAKSKRKEEDELAEAQRLETIQVEREAEEKKQEEERLAESKRKEKEELADAQRLEIIQREKEAEDTVQEENMNAGANGIEDKRLAGLANLVFINAALQTAIAGKNMKKLEKAIADVEDNDVVDDLADLHKQATTMFKQLKKEKIKKNIQELKRPLIAELKSMSSPPVDVHRAMTAAFLLMGENLKDLKKWSNIVILLGKMGKEAVKRRVMELKIEDVTENMVATAEKQILGLTSGEVYVVNQAASYFYDWADMICVERKQLN